MNTTSEKSQHTPGEWITSAEEWRTTITAQQSGRDDKIIAEVFHVPDSSPHELEASPVGLANARLISAAPDLLQACKSLMEELESRFDYVEPTLEESAALCKVEAAISKAEGRSL